MSESVTVPSAEEALDCPPAGRRAARLAKFERERLIVDSLNRGLPVAAIAERIGVTEKRLRALMKEIFARRAPAAPEDYAALQASRLNEALLVAYSAMSPDNLKAVSLVVRIVRELDRYCGFRAPTSPASPGKASGEARRMGWGKQHANSDGEPDESCEPAGVEAAGRVPSVSFGGAFTSRVGDGETPAIRPETAPETFEKIELTPGNVAPPSECEAARSQGGGAASASPDDVGAEAVREAFPADAGSAPAEPRAGAESALQTIENTHSAPEGGVAAAEPLPSTAAFAVRAASPEPARPIDPQPAEWRESTSVVLAPDPAAPGGFRRMRIRLQRNGVAACADPV